MQNRIAHMIVSSVVTIDYVFYNNIIPTDLKDKSRVVNGYDEVTMRMCSNSKHLKISKIVMPDECIKDLNSHNSLLPGLMREHKHSNLVTVDIEYIFHIFLLLNSNESI